MSGFRFLLLKQKRQHGNVDCIFIVNRFNVSISSADWAYAIFWYRILFFCICWLAIMSGGSQEFHFFLLYWSKTTCVVSSSLSCWYRLSVADYVNQVGVYENALDRIEQRLHLDALLKYRQNRIFPNKNHVFSYSKYKKKINTVNIRNSGNGFMSSRYTVVI